MQYIMVSKKKNALFLRITVCHHLASLVMPNGDPQDRFFYPTLTLMIDSYMQEYYHIGRNLPTVSTTFFFIKLQIIVKVWNIIEPD